MDEGIAAYLGLAFVAQGEQVNSPALLEVQGGRLLAEVERGRGHCHRIGAIYRTFLDKWFSKTLDPTDYVLVKEVFASLGIADEDMFRGLVDLARKLQAEADQVLDMIFTGRPEDARTQVRTAYVTLKPLRVQLGQAMAKLYSLRNEFVEMAGVA